MTSNKTMFTSNIEPYAAMGVIGLVGLGKYLDEKYYIRKDLRIISGLGSFALIMKQRELLGWSIADGLESAAKKFQDKSAIEFENQTISFLEWDKQANKIARWALSIGVRKGDVLALIMENRPEHMFFWCGLAKIGAVAALINYNLRDKALVHCIKVASCTRVVYGAEIQENINDAVLNELSSLGISCYVQGASSSSSSSPSLSNLVINIDQTWASMDASPIDPKYRKGVKYTDAAMYIYTSGTTGLPKAAIVRHAKLDGAGSTFPLQFRITSNDRIYNSGLPLYHSAANNIGGGVCIKTGATLVLRKKFSASKFWEDVAKTRCTVIQYIGELCRYLLAAPPTAWETKHICRLAVGNGLRPDIWKEFQTRFRVPEVGEFYGSTEGNVALFNHCMNDEAQGAVGHMGLLMTKFAGLCTIVEYDHNRGDVVRDPKTGFCKECLPGIAGEAIAEMKGRAAGSFDGYLGDKEQSEKKLLKNVFRKGDSWFRTGDLIMRNAQGYYFFVDRLGDTFRWKGENVATTEVAEVIGKVTGVLDANVYGVQIPGKDGRACCAALTSKPGETINLDDIANEALSKLPNYAVPLFIRLMSESSTTGTLKLQKVSLRDEGIDISKIQDPLYFLDLSTKKYIPLTPTVYSSIIQGQSRL